MNGRNNINNINKIFKKIKQQENENSSRGKLKIFFGYAAGVGKTYAMLKAAHTAKELGIDVVIGYVEPHTRPETMDLLEGLEVIDNLTIDERGVKLKEFDIDAAIERNPQLILVDELAHTNASGLRHLKRYQDIEELLRMGINVYTTVNVQHIESLNDIVQSFTGITVNERIPDYILDKADQIELIDIETDDLIKRLLSGKIYQPEKIEEALNNFFKYKNLVALRELSLRRTADCINKEVIEKQRISTSESHYISEHILVCLSGSPSNAKVIRTAIRMAEAYKCRVTALYVEPSNINKISTDEKVMLSKNTKLAEQLGARVVTVYGDDVANQIIEYVKTNGVSKIVIGRPVTKKTDFFSKDLVDVLSSLSQELEIYVIPNKLTSRDTKGKSSKFRLTLDLSDTAISLLILTLSTLVGFVFFNLNYGEANIITFYILGVLFTAVFTKNRVYSIISSIIAVFAFNFFFTEPRFTFETYNPGYPITFLVMFISAVLTSSLTYRAKISNQQATMKAYRTEVLLETSMKLQSAKTKMNLFNDIAEQLLKLFKRSTVVYPAENSILKSPIIKMVEHEFREIEDLAIEEEKNVANWVFLNNKNAGAGTNTLPDAKSLYMPIRSNETIYGVVGISTDRINKLDIFEKNLLMSILSQAALVLENMDINEQNIQISLKAEQETLRSNLLRSISHDLRTPLTSISGNASLLLSNDKSLAEIGKRDIYESIYHDSIWLISLIENLLAISRIENENMELAMNVGIVDEIINEALERIPRDTSGYKITVSSNDDIICAYIDFRLIIQVIINLVDNSVKYTEPGSEINISYYLLNDKIYIKIADNGKGIPDYDKENVFNLFYSRDKELSDSRRGLGIGLSLCKSIIKAHGGDIWIEDNHPHGCVVVLTLNAAKM